MKFTPNCVVSYKGVFHKAGIPFDIDSKDVNSMKKYGVVDSSPSYIETKRDDSQTPNEQKSMEQTTSEERQSKRTGRPRRIEQ